MLDLHCTIMESATVEQQHKSRSSRAENTRNIYASEINHTLNVFKENTRNVLVLPKLNMSTNSKSQLLQVDRVFYIIFPL